MRGKSKPRREECESKTKMNKCTFHQGHARKEIINMEAGNRTLCIASLNPDTFVNPEQRLTITNMLNQQKIHIAAIQETHTYHMNSITY